MFIVQINVRTNKAFNKTLHEYRSTRAFWIIWDAEFFSGNLLNLTREDVNAWSN